MKEYLFAIDSSLSSSGFAIFSKNGKLVHYGSIPTDNKDSIQKRLKTIGETLKKYRKQFPCDVLVLEEGFYRFHDVTKKLSKVRGVIEYIFYDCEILSYSPRTVKKAVTGSAKAEKEEVANGVLKKYPKIIFDKCYDITDAIGVGITYFKNLKGEI